MHYLRFPGELDKTNEMATSRHLELKLRLLLPIPKWPWIKIPFFYVILLPPTPLIAPQFGLRLAQLSPLVKPGGQNCCFETAPSYCIFKVAPDALKASKQASLSDWLIKGLVEKQDAFRASGNLKG